MRANTTDYRYKNDKFYYYIIIHQIKPSYKSYIKFKIIIIIY